MFGTHYSLWIGTLLAIGSLLPGGCAQTTPNMGYPTAPNMGYPTTPNTGYPSAQPSVGPTRPYGGGPAWSGAPGSVQSAPPQLQPPASAISVPRYSSPLPPAPAEPRLERPKWRNPGTIAQQRQQAEKYDPYASIDAAPEIVGGRPRDFLYPTPEASRSNKFRGNFE